MNLHYDAPPSPAPSAHGTRPLPRPGSTATLAGLLLLALGVTVMAGWLLQNRAMVEFHAGMVAVIFNTALGFALTGVALALPGLLRRPLAPLQNAVGAGLLLLGSAVLYEHVSDISLGIDWACAAYLAA